TSSTVMSRVSSSRPSSPHCRKLSCDACRIDRARRYPTPSHSTDRVHLHQGDFMKRVLFLCTGNACRSQMAEGWTRHLHGDFIEPLSAGTDPRGLDPRAVQVMRVAGVVISTQRSKHVDELL